MQVVVTITKESQERAFARASRIPFEIDLSTTTLNAALETDLTNYAGRLWQHVEDALLEARRKGAEAARPFIERFEELLEEAAAKTQHNFDVIRSSVAERMNAYMQSCIESALMRVLPSVTIGSESLRVKSVTVEQKLRLSGSLKASLESLCEFTAEGEISLSVDYSQGGTP